MQTNQNAYQEDEVDLHDFFFTLIKNKKIIFVTITLVMLVTISYFSVKSPIPLYKGNIMIEIGEVQSNSLDKMYLDNPYVLKSIIEKKYKAEVQVPKRTNSIIVITVKDTDKKSITKKLKRIFKYVIDRDKEKSKMYDRYIMTKEVGNFDINDTPVNLPNKRLILVIAFVIGLILSVLLVFFFEFLKLNYKIK